MPATRHQRLQQGQARPGSAQSKQARSKPAPPALRQVKLRRRLNPVIFSAAVAAVVVVTVAGILLRPGAGAPRAGGQTRGATIAEATPSAGGGTGPAVRERSIRAQLGVYQGTDPSAVRAFERWLGHRVRYVVDFSPRGTWSDISTPTHQLAEWRGSDHRLVHAVPMLPDSAADSSSGSKLASMRAGARGDYDKYFVTLGKNLVASGQGDAVLRIGWEFNIESWLWGLPQKNAAVYRAYFRRIVTAMRSVPGERFNVNWNVNNGFNPNDGAKYWPGDAYVDSIGVDVYDLDGTVYPYPKRCDALCRETLQIRAWEEVIYGGPRGLGFWTYFAQRHGKPMTLPEWGLWNKIDDGSGGGDNPFFIQQMHLYISSPQNNVAMAAYFNLNGGDGPHDLMKSFPVAGKVFKRYFGSRAAR